MKTLTKFNKPVVRRVIQICSAHAMDGNDDDESGRISRNTLFVLTDDGEIWTRAYRDGNYAEWFTVSQDIETR